MARKKTSNDYHDDVNALLRQANALPHGSTRVALCEEAVQLADVHNDVPLAYRARMELVEAGTFAGMTDIVLVAFAWCLARYDEHPEDYSGYELLWRMKWVSDDLANYPEISLQQIFSMLDDMETRFLAYCGSIQPVLSCRREVHLMVGDIAGAKEINKRYARMPRTFLSDCHACELDGNANYYIDIGQRALGIRKLLAVINGDMRCATVPARTYSALLIPLMEAGRAQEAVDYHRIGYPMVRKLAGRAANWADNTLLLALTGNDAKAVKCIERHLGAVEQLPDPHAKMGYFRDLMVAVECLAERKATVKMRLPDDSPLANPDGQYDTASLAAKIRALTLDLSKRFDARNGNTYYVDLLNNASRVRKHAVRIPV